MATTEEKNLADFRTMVHTLTGGETGVKSAGHIFVNVTQAAQDAAWLRDAFTSGVAGKRQAGFLLAMLSRIDGNAAASNATIQALVGALKAVTAGETFDEAKLLDSIAKTTREAFDAALKAAAPAEVTLKVEGEDK